VSNKGSFGRAMISAAGSVVESEIREGLARRRLRTGECLVTGPGALPFLKIVHIAKPTPHFGEMNALDQCNLESCIDNLLS
jgi:hypothetical protein